MIPVRWEMTDQINLSMFETLWVLSSDVAFPEKYFPENFLNNQKNMFDS